MTMNDTAQPDLHSKHPAIRPARRPSARSLLGMALMTGALFAGNVGAQASTTFIPSGVVTPRGVSDGRGGFDAPINSSYGAPSATTSTTTSTTSTAQATTVLSSAPVVSEPLKNVKPYSNVVSITTPIGGTTLEGTLQTLTRAVGLSPVLFNIPDVKVNVNLKGKSYASALDTLVKVYGGGKIGYQLLSGGVLVIADGPTLSRLRGDIGSRTTDAAGQEIRVYTTTAAAADVASALKGIVDNAGISTIGNTILVRGSEQVQLRVANLIEQIDRASSASIKNVTGDGTVGAGAANAGSTTSTGTVGSSTTGTSTTGSVPPSGPVRGMPAAGNPEPEKPVLALITYPLLGVAADVQSILQAYAPTAKIAILPGLKMILVEADVQTQDRVRTLLSTVNAESPAPVLDDSMIETTYALVGNNQEILSTVKSFFPGIEAYLLDRQSLLVVRAAPEMQVRVIRLLNQINVPLSDDALAKVDSREVMQEVMTLNYAKTDVMIGFLQKLFPDLQAAAPTAGPATPAAAPVAAPIATIAGAPAPLVLVSDNRTNSIIASGTRRQLTQLRAAISKLDVAVHQLRLKVRVEQISTTDGSNLGVNWKVGLGGVSVAGGPDGLAVGYSMTNSPASISVKLDALKQAGLSKTVMDTTFVVADNEAGKFKGGGTLHIGTTSSATSATGTSTSTKSFSTYDYGLVLNFTPRLSKDGNIELTVNADISSRPTGDFNSYFITEGNSITSKVNFASGQTLVLGGLINNNSNDTSTGVPLLQDIPILGSLFKKTTRTADASTLLIVLSGEIIDNRGNVISTDLSSAVIPGTAASRGTQTNASNSNIPVGGK